MSSHFSAFFITRPLKLKSFNDNLYLLHNIPLKSRWSLVPFKIILPKVKAQGGGALRQKWVQGHAARQTPFFNLWKSWIQNHKISRNVSDRVRTFKALFLLWQAHWAGMWKKGKTQCLGISKNSSFFKFYIKYLQFIKTKILVGFLVGFLPFLAILKAWQKLQFCDFDFSYLNKLKRPQNDKFMPQKIRRFLGKNSGFFLDPHVPVSHFTSSPPLKADLHTPILSANS